MWEPVALCCFSRKTGSLVLGSLEVIGAIMGLVYGVYLIVTSELDHSKHICNLGESSGMDYYCGFFFQAADRTGAVLIGVYLVQLVCASMMIHGVRKNDSCLMAPYLIKNVIILGLNIIVAVLVTLFLCTLRFILAALFAYCYGALIFLWTYFLLTVRAHFYELKRGKDDDHHRLVENCELENGGNGNKM